ncbi:MAG: XRE family transcriptional regulator [Deltaproteobacteria bacterium]|nr:cupin domain-containing protein [Deltaproteobacteria bacterium]MBW2077029.1 cupin domain-containing protein [Deltaproteobacteria bacterium]MBW2312280.1 cupin domain-containing protein [Deltaproteobacteria bacterium]RLB30029.1 MAG: XRE family transcriptional regulator [Deltaproteobacteria bacterium]
MKEKKSSDETYRYKDFLHDLGQFYEKDKGKHAVDSSTRGRSGEEAVLKVGGNVREIRERKGLSLRDISQRTGLAVELLSEIEEGTVAPPLGTIIKLAKALEMKTGYFISGTEELPYTIMRKDNRKLISRYNAKESDKYGYEFYSLAPYKKNRHMEPFIVTLEPSDIEELTAHDGQEFIYVLEGTMEVRLADETHLLEPGDAIYYDSTVPHLVKCHGSTTTKILAVLHAE